VDHPQESPRVLSTCTGYGGLEIGVAEAVGPLRVLAYVEREAFACANLVAQIEAGRLPAAPVWTDLRSFDARPLLGCVDILTGGYPCQPFSIAGDRRGEADPRHLWPSLRRIIGECRPGWCFFENVRGHVSLGLRDVRRDLAKLGYRVEAGLFSAEEVGAHHQRERVYILAHADSLRERQPEGGEPDERGRSGNGGPPLRLADACRPRVAGAGTEPARADRRDQWRVPTASSGWPSEPDVGRVVDGCPNRTDRVRLLGNGVVPACAEHAFRTLYGRLTTCA
jgi:DNA (cytosine-5)-methyltransferase 1